MHTRLKEAREQAGYPDAAAAARRFGWTETTYRAHENGQRGYKQGTAIEYGRAFRVSAEWLLFGAAEPELGTAPAKLIPIYDVHASAGDGSVVNGEDEIGSLAFPRDYLSRLTRSHPRNLKIIGVKGDSMLPTLADDDVVMIDLSKRDLSFDGLFVIRDNGDALQVKRIGRASQPGAVTIISDNRQLYPPVERSLEHIEVVGRVIWHGRKV